MDESLAVIVILASPRGREYFCRRQQDDSEPLRRQLAAHCGLHLRYRDDQQAAPADVAVISTATAASDDQQSHVLVARNWPPSVSAAASWQLQRSLPIMHVPSVNHHRSTRKVSQRSDNAASPRPSLFERGGKTVFRNFAGRGQFVLSIVLSSDG